MTSPQPRSTIGDAGHGALAACIEALAVIDPNRLSTQQTAALNAARAVLGGDPAALNPKTRDERTSDRVAAIAAIGLHAPHSLSPDQIRAVCGSALTQARNAGAGK